jgi:hypothetical protein
MSEGEGGGVILGFDVRRGGEDEPFKDVRRGGGGYFRFPPWGVWIFSGMTHSNQNPFGTSIGRVLEKLKFLLIFMRDLDIMQYFQRG